METHNNIINISALYNGEMKRSFIEQYDAIDSQLTIYWQFLKVSDYEKFRDKDMSQMSDVEIREMLLSAECSTISSAINHINTYKRYVDFIGVTTSPFYAFLSYSQLASEVIDKEKNQRYSREDLLFMIDELNNDTDKALLLALFEGIKGKSFSELLTLKMSNISKIEGKDGETYHIAKVYDEGSKNYRNVVISKDLYTLLRMADDQKSYRTNNEDETITTDFNHSEFVFKKAKKGKQGGDVLDRHFITRKFTFFKRFFGNEYLTAEDILQSGMIHMAYELFLENKKIGKSELLEIGRHYNTSMATSNGVDYYRNITDLKRKIFISQLGRVYPELEGVKYSN